MHVRKIFHVEVEKQLLLLEANINASTRENSSKSGKHVPRKSCEWFKDEHLIELLDHLKNIIIQRVVSSLEATKKSEHNLRNSFDLTTKNLKLSYCFKKRLVTVRHYALRKNNKVFHHLNGLQSKNEKVQYESFPYFHEKLSVNIWQNIPKVGHELSCIVPLYKENNDIKENFKPSTSTSSDYFIENTNQKVTSSVKRKKATLKNIAKKSKIALLRSPPGHSEPSGTNSDSTAENTDVNPTWESACATDNLDGRRSKGNKGKVVIDIDEEPEGLSDVKRVEDLNLDQLKFLVNKMEDHLRTIFRGEGHSRRHEEYKKGGKARDNLNFQVGMAHFHEDQHDCIMDTLMAIFCYNSKNVWRYMDYVIKVMLPETLIKLYMDMHGTSFEQAEECLLNDTVM